MFQCPGDGANALVVVFQSNAEDHLTPHITFLFVRFHQPDRFLSSRQDEESQQQEGNRTDEQVIDADGQWSGKSTRQDDRAPAGEVHDRVQENREDAVLN